MVWKVLSIHRRRVENGLRCLRWILPVLMLAAFLQVDAFGHGKEAGSLLVFPYYDCSPKALTLITITNTNNSTQLDPVTGLKQGTIDIMFKYIDEKHCTPSDRTERLTANDTFTFVPADHSPSTEDRGFLYVYAIDVVTGNPVAFDYLIGTETIFESEGEASFNLDPLVFRAGKDGPDEDHLLSLDGMEYEKAADQILIPRFFGQGPGLAFDSPVFSRIVLLNFTGGAYFTAFASVRIYNDNEQSFSDFVEFGCWKTMPLLELSGATSLSFLESTNHDPDEVAFGDFQMEMGWIRLQGEYAYNYTITLEKPAIYAFQIERWIANGYSSAALPFEKGLRDTGKFWSLSQTGQY